MSANATVVTLHSGNGTVGSTDSIIKFLDSGSLTADFPVLTAGNFTSAQTGTAASIIAPNGNWLASLPEDVAAKWIATNAGAANGSGDTALYAMSFVLPFPVLSATLSLHYAVDNLLGGSNNPSGVFINGTALSPAPSAGGFTTDSAYSNTTLGSLLHAGTNWIYFDANNQGGPAGFIFTATVTTVDGTTAPIPEPATFALFGGALLVLGSLRNRLKASRSN